MIPGLTSRINKVSFKEGDIQVITVNKLLVFCSINKFTKHTNAMLRRRVSKIISFNKQGDESFNEVEETAAEKAKLEAIFAKEQAKIEVARVLEEARRAAMLENEKKRTTETTQGALSSTFTNSMTNSSSKQSSQKSIGKFRKTIGGNRGASLGNGIIGTLFKE